MLCRAVHRGFRENVLRPLGSSMNSDNPPQISQGAAHLLERHFPVRGAKADSLAAKRVGGLPAPEVSERVSAAGATRPV